MSASFAYARRGRTANGHGFSAAIPDALLCASGLMLLALLVAIAELIRRRPFAKTESAEWFSARDRGSSGLPAGAA
jgi:hypothetical protein